MQPSHIPQRGYSSTNTSLCFWLPNLKKEANQKASKENNKGKKHANKQVKNLKSRENRPLKKNEKKWSSIYWVGEQKTYGNNFQIFKR